MPTPARSDETAVNDCAEAAKVPAKQSGQTTITKYEEQGKYIPFSIVTRCSMRTQPISAPGFKDGRGVWYGAVSVSREHLSRHVPSWNMHNIAQLSSRCPLARLTHAERAFTRRRRADDPHDRSAPARYVCQRVLFGSEIRKVRTSCITRRSMRCATSPGR